MKPSKFCFRAVEFRAESTGDGLTLEGYAAVFDTPTRINSWEGEFDEQISRGAFKRTIGARKPVLQFDHGHDARTGTVPIGAIEELREDEKGLFVRARLFDNPVVEPIRQAIAGGAIDGMSFRFRVNDESWQRRSGDVDLRVVREVELYELGPVVFPAYDATSVGMRSMLANLDGEDVARLLRALADERGVDIQTSEPVQQDTSDNPAEPVRQDTSRGLTPRERRERLYPFLKEGSS